MVYLIVLSSISESRKLSCIGLSDGYRIAEQAYKRAGLSQEDAEATNVR
jgi:hypothetical protein